MIFMIGAFYSGSLVLAAIFEVKLEVNSKGEMREVVETEKWQNLSKEQKRACEEPGKEIPLLSDNASMERVDFFHYIQVKKYNKVVVFNGEKCVGGSEFSEKEKRG